MVGVDASIANALRRILLAEVSFCFIVCSGVFYSGNTGDIVYALGYFGNNTTDNSTGLIRFRFWGWGCGCRRFLKTLFGQHQESRPLEISKGVQPLVVCMAGIRREGKVER